MMDSPSVHVIPMGQRIGEGRRSIPESGTGNMKSTRKDSLPRFDNRFDLVDQRWLRLRAGGRIGKRIGHLTGLKDLLNEMSRLENG
jgi:hypothetical protein